MFVTSSFHEKLSVSNMELYDLVRKGDGSKLVRIQNITAPTDDLSMA